MNPLVQLVEAGQSIWLDFLRRSLITGGGLRRLTNQDAVGGLTSNPTIFGRAIAGSTDYDEAIKKLVASNPSPREVFYQLALEDVAMAADVFRGLYDRTEGKDGFVSFELEPSLAHDTEGSIKAAQQLVQRIARPNVMIKVPGTREGVPAVEQLTAAGINVNITLLFSIGMYERFARARISRVWSADWTRNSRSIQSPQWRLFSSHASTVPSTPYSKTGPRLRARSQLPMQGSRTTASRRSSPARAGSGSPPRGRVCSVRCGRRPAPRTPPTPMSSTSRSWSLPTRSIRCRRRRWTPFGTTAGCGPWRGRKT
jgi:hypothetical protein